MHTSALFFTDTLEETLQTVLAPYSPSQVFVLCDTTTEIRCLPLIRSFKCLNKAVFMAIPAGDQHKEFSSLRHIWQILSSKGATRKSVIINLGGGMVTDIGGFAGASFKRGIDVINLPTTILGAVDAAVGGKTGINFNGLKNEIGAFHLPVAVLFYTPFFSSLNKENRLSGFAEMLKHGLLFSGDYLQELMALDLNHTEDPRFAAAIRQSVEIKANITEQDPTEKGIRKALNLGHTVGHAFESLSHHKQSPILHGYAIAWGLLCELYLSVKQAGFPESTLLDIIHFVKQSYGTFHIDQTDDAFLYETMTHDKKNESSAINFTLLAEVGTIKLDQTADKTQINAMFDFYRKTMEA